MVSPAMTVAAFLWSAIRVMLAVIVVIGVWHRLSLLRRRGRIRGGVSDTSVEVDKNQSLPSMTLQLPVYNERYVVTRLLEAVGNLDYPQDGLLIQVLDDSDAGDGTSEAVDGAVEKLREHGWRAEILRRRERVGFKAGALQAGLSSATGDFVAILDADFVPEEDFLRRMMTCFQVPDGRRVGMVQARWGFLNADKNWLTRVQAWFLDAHFRIEHAARWRSGCCFNFNGTAGVWRRECIDDAGGWQGDTLTEDLDVSYRAQVNGWKFVYVDDVVVPSELPSTWAAFKNQQFRWAKGATEVARKLLPTIWGRESHLTARAKWEATMHLTSQAIYLVFPGLLLGGAMAALMGTVSSDGASLLLRGVGALAMLTALAFFSATSIFLRPSRRLKGRDIVALFLTVPVAIGLAISNSRAVLEGWMGRQSPFERTPKTGNEPVNFRPEDRYRSAASAIWSMVELMCGVGMLAALVDFLLRSQPAWFDAALLVPVAVGFLWCGLGSLAENFSRSEAGTECFADVAVDEPCREGGSLRDQSDKCADISPSTS